MAIVGIDEIVYGATDLDRCRAFFEDWGLEQSGTDGAAARADRLVYETGNGGRVVVADAAAADLPPAFEEGSTLRTVVWGVDSAEDLARLRPLLEAEPGFVDAGGRIGCTDPNGMAVRFEVSTKRPVTVEGARANTWDRRERVNEPAPIYQRAAPIEVGHVVFFVGDFESTVAFYRRLGFVISDSYPGRGAFMRCSERGGHHDLFLLKSPDGRRGLNHVAFTVRDIHEVFGGGLFVSGQGWETQLGPGRHPISSAYFWYFRNPAGGLIEYYADEDELTEAWQPREFEPGPTVFAEWAIDGGLDGRTRRQKGRQADGKFLTDKRS